MKVSMLSMLTSLKNLFYYDEINHNNFIIIMRLIIFTCKVCAVNFLIFLTGNCVANYSYKSVKWMRYEILCKDMNVL